MVRNWPARYGGASAGLSNASVTTSGVSCTRDLSVSRSSRGLWRVSTAMEFFSLSNARETLFASTTRGLEPVLEAEVRALGHLPRRVAGGVEWSGPRGAHQEANLC